jgi:hypothetical protein
MSNLNSDSPTIFWSTALFVRSPLVGRRVPSAQEARTDPRLAERPAREGWSAGPVAPGSSADMSTGCGKTPTIPSSDYNNGHHIAITVGNMAREDRARSAVQSHRRGVVLRVIQYRRRPSALPFAPRPPARGAPFVAGNRQ